MCKAPQEPFGKVMGAFFGPQEWPEGCHWGAVHGTMPLSREQSRIPSHNPGPVRPHVGGGKPVNLNLEPSSILHVSVKCVNTELSTMWLVGQLEDCTGLGGDLSGSPIHKTRKPLHLGRASWGVHGASGIPGRGRSILGLQQILRGRFLKTGTVNHQVCGCNKFPRGFENYASPFVSPLYYS